MHTITSHPLTYVNPFMVGYVEHFDQWLIQYFPECCALNVAFWVDDIHSILDAIAIAKQEKVYALLTHAEGTEEHQSSVWQRGNHNISLWYSKDRDKFYIANVTRNLSTSWSIQQINSLEMAIEKGKEDYYNKQMEKLNVAKE